MTAKKTIAIGMTLWGAERTPLEELTINLYLDAARKSLSKVHAVVVAVGHHAQRSRVRVVSVDGEEPRWGEIEGIYPLGKKHNAMLSVVREFDPDAFVLVGSDDWMDDECFLRYANYLERGYDLVTMADIYVMHAATGAMVRYNSPAIGVGRMVSRNVLERCHWTLWEDALQRKLDNSMMNHIIRGTHGKHRGHHEAMRTTNAVIVDIKTAQNLWSYDRFATRGFAVPPEERDFIFSRLPSSSLVALENLYPECKP